MNKFAVILPYFGKFKPSFALFYESARRNDDVDFFIFTDDDEPINPAENIKWIKTTLSEFNDMAVQKLGIDFKIPKPYKLCDFKPMYGLICEDYLKGYEYWAYGDVDLIYGHISEFMDKIDYRKFDKINHAGHLCFMKNVPEINELFKVQAEGSKDFKEVLFSGNVAFDELDMNKKAKTASVKLYDGVFAADIMNEKGMQVVDKEHIEKGFKIKTAYPSPKNYHYQIFVSENGRIFRYYRSFFKVKKDEFCYMHYRLELPVLLSDKKSDTFIVSFKQNGFFDFDIKDVKTLKSFMKTVKTYNTRKPIIVEKFNALKNKINGILKKGEN